MPVACDDASGRHSNQGKFLIYCLVFCLFFGLVKEGLHFNGPVVLFTMKV